MASIQVGSILSEAWDLTKKNLVLIIFLIVTSALTSALQPSNLPADMSTQDLINVMTSGDTAQMQQLTAQMNQSQMEMSGGSILRMILSIVVSLLLSVGLTNTFLMIANGKMTSVSIDGFKLPVAIYVKAALASILSSLLICISAALCIIPVFYVAPKVMFAPFYIIDGRAEGVIESIKMNWADSEGNVANLIGLGFTIIGINILGLICCCCGVLVTEVTTYFCLALAYMALSSERPVLNSTSEVVTE